ncbi:MAG TPA: ribbon-helix-helix domain-containing protein [Acidimicrobiales bacterium]|nr:ribbon-helix-helix domain-containing protein [Acidimicrobiales bacterium]
MTQIAAKLPDDLVRRVDQLVADGLLPSRSWAVRRGLEMVVADTRASAIDRAFREAYSRVPETGAELEEARQLALRSIQQEPWERWW